MPASRPATATPSPTTRRSPPGSRRSPAPDAPAPAAHPASPHGPSLLIAGPTGTGKTHQAYGAIRALLAAGVRLRWEAITAADLYARLRPRPATTPNATCRRSARCPLLLLDDLGAAKSREWTEELTYRLINHRYNAPAPDPDHHQPAHRRPARRPRRPRRLPPRRDDRPRHPHRPRPQAPVPNLTGPGDSPRRTRDRKPQMVRDRAPPTQGTERGLTRGPVPFAVPAGDGPPNTPSGTGPAKNRGPVPVRKWGPVPRRFGDRSPSDTADSGTGPNKGPGHRSRGPEPGTRNQEPETRTGDGDRNGTAASRPRRTRKPTARSAGPQTQ